MKTINSKFQLLVLAVNSFLVALAINSGVLTVLAQVNSVMLTHEIKYRSTVVMADGSPPPEELDTTVSRRSNGDEFTTYTPPGIREVHLFSRGLLVVINEKAALVMTLGSGKPSVDMPTHPFGTNCETFSADLTGESRTILGFRVLRLVAAPNEIEGKRESWLAPDLNCEPLLETTRSLTIEDVYAPGRVYRTTTKTATSASQTPASDDLFAIPVGYTEVPPSIFWPAAGREFSEENVDAYNKQKAEREAAKGVGPKGKL